MKTRMPFGGFFLKLLDEQNGTCEYEEYQRKCEEEPLTEEEQKEQAEQAGGRSKTAVGIDPGGNYAMVICI
jgi:hypothetical protein